MTIAEIHSCIPPGWALAIPPQLEALGSLDPRLELVLAGDNRPAVLRLTVHTAWCPPGSDEAIGRWLYEVIVWKIAMAV